MRTAKAAGRAEVAEGGRAEGTARSVSLRRLHCLMYALKEVGDLRLGLRCAGFYPALCGAAFTEVQQADACALDLCQLNNRIRFLANIADHTNPPTR